MNFITKDCKVMSLNKNDKLSINDETFTILNNLETFEINETEELL